jgi:hypothetical protein
LKYWLIGFVGFGLALSAYLASEQRVQEYRVRYAFVSYAGIGDGRDTCFYSVAFATRYARRTNEETEAVYRWVNDNLIKVPPKTPIGQPYVRFKIIPQVTHGPASDPASDPAR